MLASSSARRLAAVLDLELATEPCELRAALVHVCGDADRPRLVRDRALTGLADPPGRVCRELEALPPVELLDRAVEADDAFLDEVAEGDAVASIALRDGDDEAQVRVDHALLGGLVATLDSLGESDLFGRGEQVVLPDLVHEQRQRVGRYGSVGLEAELGLVIRLVLVLALVRGHELHSAGLELRAQGSDLVVLELELEG